MREGGSGTERSWCQRDVLSQPRSSSHHRPDRSRRRCWPFLLLPGLRSRPPSSPSPSLHLSRPPRVGRRTLAEGALRKVKKMWRHVHLKWKLLLWVFWGCPFFLREPSRETRCQAAPWWGPRLRFLLFGLLCQLQLLPRLCSRTQISASPRGSIAGRALDATKVKSVFFWLSSIPVPVFPFSRP